MKKLQSIIFTLFTSIVLFAQSPPSINYQAIAWNIDGTPKALKTINVEFKIHTLRSDGAVEFSEKFLTSTNDQGLFTLAIGSTKLSEFQNVDWAKGPKYLEVVVDNLSVGTTQILSVPYALYAEKTNLKAGAGISVSGNTITNTGDRDTTNEIQRLSLNGTQLTLSKSGGTVTLPASGGSATTYSSGSGISISPTNVISTDLKAGEGISIVGNTISNTNTGGGGTGTTYTAGTGIKISGNTISNTGDGDSSTTNEIQQITRNGNTLTLSKNGGSVDLPTGGGTGTTYTAGTGIAIDVSNKISTTNSVPAGSIMAFAGLTPPTGWLKCDGALVFQKDYPDLYNAIGSNWGTGSSARFRLPDLRGMFLRGVDETANNDLDKDIRTAKYTGGMSGNEVGSYQADQFQGHFHSGSITFASSQPGTGAAAGTASRFQVPGVLDPVSDGKNDDPRTGKETRPKNVYVLYIIKY